MTRRRGTCPRCRSSSSAATRTGLPSSDLLTRQRLVEIVGPGGVGKTALAIDTGRRLNLSNDVGAGGVWLARLETAVTPGDVIDTLIAALNVGGETALLERLKQTEALVILDNCEHVIDAAAALTVRLLDAAPGLRVLCTSQVPLGVDGEAVFELAPLGLTDAVELFTHRASAQRRHRPLRRRRRASSTCAARSTDSRWPSSWPRHGPRRCRSTRSPGASTIVSTS